MPHRFVRGGTCVPRGSCSGAFVAPSPGAGRGTVGVRRSSRGGESVTGGTLSASERPAANEQHPDIPVEVYVEHALIGAAYSARMFGDNPELPPEAVKAYRWAEGEFNRIAKKEVGERDLIG